MAHSLLLPALRTSGRVRPQHAGCSARATPLVRCRQGLHTPAVTSPTALRLPLPCRRLRLVLSAAAPKRAPESERKLTRRPPPRRQGDGDDSGARWQLFDLSLYQRGWEVPWGVPTVAVGLLGWAASFLLTGLFVVPLLAGLQGISLRDLASTQKTEYIMAVQAWETVQGIAIIWACVRSFQPLPPDFFRIDSSKPLSPENGWVVWGLLGYGATFVAIGAAAGLSALFTQSAEPSGNGTVDAIVPLIGPDPQGFVSLLLVTSVLAPALEEVVFRGFLLPSLTKWMSAPAAVVASSTIFAAAHFAPRDFPQLLALGLVLGFSYVRTRNLLTPMMVHSLWNTGVLTALTVLSASGADLNDIVR